MSKIKCGICGKPENLIVKEHRRDTQGNKFDVYQETTGVSYGEWTDGFKGWICKACMNKRHEEVNKKKGYIR